MTTLQESTKPDELGFPPEGHSYTMGGAARFLQVDLEDFEFELLKRGGHDALFVESAGWNLDRCRSFMDGEDFEGKEEI